MGNIFQALSTGEKWAVVTTVIGLLHHADHILRVDHSGWPFTQHVSPFTFSLLVYPVIASLFILRTKKWYRVYVMALLLILIQAAHIFIEQPRDQYHVWAHNSSRFASTLGQPNLLNIESSLLGMLAVFLSFSLSISILITLVYFAKDAKRDGLNNR